MSQQEVAEVIDRSGVNHGRFDDDGRTAELGQTMDHFGRKELDAFGRQESALVLEKAGRALIGFCVDGGGVVYHRAA